MPPLRPTPAFVAAVVVGLTASFARAQEPGIPDPFGLLRPQPYVAARSSSNNPDPDSNDDSKRPIPGETITLAELQGPGSISHIWMTIADNEYGWPRLLRLRIYYDGSAEPSVDAPVGDFFAVGHGFERKVQSLMVRDGSEGRSRNSYWPMPFRKSCRVTVTNEGQRRVANLYYQVDWQKLRSLPADTPYFHARYRQMLPNSGGRHYEVLSATGRGHFVGTVFSVVQAEAGWFGEGDDLFYVDGEPKPSIEGTGTEDYFNDAWGLHVSEGAYTGVPVAEGTGLGSRMTAYCWHLADPVPFTKSLRFVMEHKGWTFGADGSVKSAFGDRTDLISSVAFWYQQGIATDQPPLPYGSARLPQGNALQIEVEKSLADVKAERGKASLSPDLFWSKDVLLFEAEGPGARVEIPFDVPAAGDYELYAELAQGSDYGVYTALLDGRKAQAAVLEHEPGADVIPQTQFDGYAPETYVGAGFQIGWPRLTKGRHTLTFVCAGKREDSAGYVLGVDDFVLARTGPLAWAEASSVRPPRQPSGSAGDLARDLADADPVTRGLAAIALRDRGAGALPALGALESALRDPDTGVRMMSGNAIAAIGPGAAGAVPALTAACSVKDEHAHVLRACAQALGAIGPAARSSLPVLRQLLALPRVRWAAEAAIRKLE